MNGATTYVVTMAGCIIFNNSGDGVRVDNTNPIVSISGSTIRNSGGYGINGGVNSNKVSVSGCRMFSNASGDMADYSGMLAAISQVGQFVKEIIVGETTATTTGRKLTLATGLNTELVKIQTVNAGFSNTSLAISASNIASGTGYDFISAGNASGGAFRVRGDGTIFADVGTISTPADYAEMFEWVDGNPNNEDRVGHTVSLIGNKIKIAEAGETAIGIVSAAPMIVGDAAPMRWQQAHVKDDFGKIILEDYEVVEWIEHDAGEFHVELDEMGKQKIVVDREGGEIVRSYASDVIPSNVTVPDDATRVTLQRPTENPEWNKETIYQPRTERKEWSAIGLVGKLRMKAGQVTNSNWIKMQNITDSVEEWLIK